MPGWGVVRGDGVPYRRARGLVPVPTLYVWAPTDSLIKLGAVVLSTR